MHSESLAGAVGLLEGRELLADEPLCLNLRGRMEHCERCAQVCHAGALRLSADFLEVDQDRCTGCGACVPACPAGALHLTGFSPARFLDALGDQREVHLHCTESRDSGGGVVIPCYKVLDERLFAAARGAGVEVFHLHGLEQCQGCRHSAAPASDAVAHEGELPARTRAAASGNAGTPASLPVSGSDPGKRPGVKPNTRGDTLRHLAGIRLLLRDWLGAAAPKLRPAMGGSDESMVLRKRQDQPHLSRRAFLRFAGARAVTGAAQWLIPVEEDQGVADLPFFQGDPQEVRRPHPYQALLARHVGDIPWAGAPPWRLRTLGSQCTACLACGQRCPTGALRAVEDGQSQGISFEVALCTDCSLCEMLCPVDAVQARPARGPDAISAPRSTLMMRRLATCAGCGTAFVPAGAGATTCPICTNERELDDEWLAMLEG